jgi:putative restriction endonuclease
VLALSKTHHAAFDRELFTIDVDYRLRVNPSFETESDLLQRTIIERADEQVPLPDGSLNGEYLAEHNASLAWV